MNFFKRQTPITMLLFVVCLALMGVAAILTIQFFATNNIVKMLIALGLIGVGWYLGALATINMLPISADDENKQ